VNAWSWIQPAGPIGPNNPWYQGPDIETHRFAYDKNGQKSSYTDPRGRVTTYTYDVRNRPWKTNETVNSLPRTTETLYDPVGNKTVVKFPENNGVIATQQWPLYTAFGQPRQFIDERGTSTELHYFPWGPMKKLAQVITHRQRDDGQMENQMTEFFPTLLGQPWLTRFPDLSTEETTYRFGLVSTFKTRKNQVKTISYDGRGREYSHVWSDGTPGVTRAWDDAGRVLSLTNRFSAIDYGYDDAGQVTYEGTHVLGSGARNVVSYWRYPNGDVARITCPSGLAIRRSYTSRGQLKTVEESSGQPLASYQYLQDGKLEFQDYGNGVRAAYGYDERGFIGSISHERNSIQLSKRIYWRDNRDRIVAWEKGGNPSGVNPRENGRGDRYKY
jgi:YD repeat-containing protein